MVGWLTGPPAGWRAGWLTGWLAGLLAGEPAGCLQRFGFGVFCGKVAVLVNLAVVLGLEIQFFSFRGLAVWGTFFLPGSGLFCETVVPKLTLERPHLGPRLGPTLSSLWAQDRGPAGCWLAGSWLAGWPAGWTAGRLAGPLAGLHGWQADWLADWLAGSLLGLSLGIQKGILGLQAGIIGIPKRIFRNPRRTLRNPFS